MSEKLVFRQIEVSVTSRCNLNCLHCYQANEKNRYTLSKDTILEFVSFAVSKQCENYVFSGGEFFMHPNAYELLHDIHLMTSPSNIRIVTNGTLIDTAQLDDLSADRITFTVSIDGFETEHDKRRGVGTFKRSLNNMRLLKKKGFRVEANVSLAGHNIREIENLLLFLANEFDAITLIPVGEAGAAQQNAVTLDLGNEELSEVFPLIYKKLSRPALSERCYIFPRGLSLNYDGTVYPCSVARDFQIFPMGNIHSNSIEEIIESFSASREGQMLLNYKSRFDIPECQTCHAKDVCQRGCRVRAYKWHGRLNAPDPFACKVYTNRYNEYTFSEVYWGNK